jgi:hypothetical protein
VFWRSRSRAGESEGFWSGKRLLQRKPFLLALLFVAISTQVVCWVAGLNFVEWISVDAFVFSLVALVVALQHTNDLETVKVEIGGIARSLPTRGIGVFPSYMDEVADLADRATKSIKILCDTPAHGSFSNTAAFSRYWKTLRSKAADGGVRVECAFFDAPGRKELHEVQTEEEENWEDWRQRNQKNCEAFDKFAREHDVEPPSSRPASDPLAAWADRPEMFVESMMAINQIVLKSLEVGAHVESLSFDRPLKEGPTVYLWLRDEDQEAVFVMVPVRGIGVRDLAGFHTREPELIRALNSVFKHRREA